MPARRPLDTYRAKRDFETTSEPPPSDTPLRPGPLRFMVHKHNATRLHYDLRLELDGVLVSFAVPRGPSADPKERRLAVHVLVLVRFRRRRKDDVAQKHRQLCAARSTKTPQYTWTPPCICPASGHQHATACRYAMVRYGQVWYGMVWYGLQGTGVVMASG